MRTIKFRALDDGKMIYQTGALIDLRRFFRIIREDAILMQYTGLNSKDNKEIYEGDIVKTDSGANQKVCWREDIAMFVLRFNEGASTNITTDCEVIGNIHENNELLK